MILNKIIIFWIRLYQRIISPGFPSSCRFYPTCSEYALTAFSKYSFFKSSSLTIKRIIHCHPFHPGGYDPVP